MSILSDREIVEWCENGMIDPFEDRQIKEHPASGHPVISYGVSSFGYDFRVASEFKLFSRRTCRIENYEEYLDYCAEDSMTPLLRDGWDVARLGSVHGFQRDLVIDPKKFDERICKDVRTDVLVMPPHSFALSYSVERFCIPDDIMVVCVGKSTYARCGLIVGITPLEPGWEGHLTLEISNTTPLPAKVYAGEGIAQALFFRGTRPKTTYRDRAGKYQSQPPEIVPPRIG